jgi:hypothetical protein
MERIREGTKKRSEGTKEFSVAKILADRLL